MKKIVSLLMAVLLVAAVFVGCSKGPKDYSLAIGVAVSSDSADQTVAAIVTDANGKIVLCRLDCVSYTAEFTDGALDTTAPTSKVALGEYYKMPSGTWAAQTAHLESFVIGKTQSEVAAIALNGGKLTDADISTKCTFVVSDILKAIDNAFKSEHKVSFKSASETFTAGLNAIAKVSAVENDATGANLVVDYAAAVLVDGAVVASILDCTDVTFNKITDGAAESVDFAGTKRVQGDAYKMTSGAWYVQADAYAVSAVGKTAADIDGLATEGVTGCTMPYSQYNFKAVISAAVKGAR